VTVINIAIKDSAPVKAAVIDLVKQTRGLLADGAENVSTKGFIYRGSSASRGYGAAWQIFRQ
jgi:hypothetical protein